MQTAEIKAEQGFVAGPAGKHPPSMKAKCIIFIVLATLCEAGSLKAQRIDFETLPGGSTPTDRMAISNQFLQDFGVSFQFETGEFPYIARVGPPQTAFTGPGGTADRPAAGENVGTFFLTESTNAGGPPPPPLVITYAQPVAAASGVIIDIDHEDAWTIEARDGLTNVVAQVVLNTSSQNTADGVATPWSFSRTNADIQSIRISFTGTSPTPGLAFDNFSPAEALPLPSPAYLSLIASNDVAKITLTGTVAAIYRIEHKPSVPAGTWTSLTNFYLPSSPFTLDDPGISNNPSRFYRAVGIQ